MAAMFLQGRQQEVIGRLSQAMDQAADELAYEQAAVYRDQIQSLRQVQDKQYVESSKGEDVDIVVVVEEGGMLCVNLAMVRGGRHLGDKTQFPSCLLYTSHSGRRCRKTAHADPDQAQSGDGSDRRNGRNRLPLEAGNGHAGAGGSP